jgi:hypothetical protein
VVNPLALQVVVTPVKWIPQYAKKGKHRFNKSIPLSCISRVSWLNLRVAE